jgi:hypothetical protein
MKNLILVFAILALSGCGYKSRNNELIGQVKKVMSQTPLICPDYNEADVSLGVIRNGVGSMSSQDKWLHVSSEKDLETIRAANESGAIVKIKYDVRRVTFCVPESVVRSVEVVK